MEAVACTVELFSVELLVEKREDVTLVGFRVILESVEEVLEVGGGGSLVAGEYLVVEMDFFDAVAFVVGFDIGDVDFIFGVVAVFNVDSACDDDVNGNVEADIFVDVNVDSDVNVVATIFGAVIVNGIADVDFEVKAVVIVGIDLDITAVVDNNVDVDIDVVTDADIIITC